MKKIFKIITLLTLILFSNLSAQAMILHGKAEINAQSAREEVFKNIKLSMPSDAFKDFWTDPNHNANYQTLQDGKTKIADRYLLLFSDGTYGLRYNHDPFHNYYYDENGILFKIDVLDKPFNVYPHKSTAYGRYGDFKNATYVVSKNEQYLYDITKRLIGHWINSACYDEDGNVLLLRRNVQ